VWSRACLIASRTLCTECTVLLDKFRALFVRFRFLLIESDTLCMESGVVWIGCRAFVIECRDVCVKHKGGLMESRALWTDYRALLENLGLFREILGCLDRILYSFSGIKCFFGWDIGLV